MEFDQEFEPEIVEVQENDEPSKSSFDYFNIPIALRKGVRSYTIHPISKYVSYQKLYPSYRTFTTNLVSVEIPSSI